MLGVAQGNKADTATKDFIELRGEIERRAG
jgi:hypothetical protein